MISTRGRYALRVMIDLAVNSEDSYVPMKDVALRQGISLKYLEQILPVLTKNGMVETMHGKGGGYKIGRKPEQIIIGDILRLTEVNLEPVACLAENAPPCDRVDKCPTINFWRGLNDVVNEYIDGVTLADMIK